MGSRVRTREVALGERGRGREGFGRRRVRTRGCSPRGLSSWVRPFGRGLGEGARPAVGGVRVERAEKRGQVAKGLVRGGCGRPREDRGQGCSRGKGSVKCGGGPGNWRLLRGGGGRLAGGRACRMVAEQEELRESPSWVTTGRPSSAQKGRAGAPSGLPPDDHLKNASQSSALADGRPEIADHHHWTRATHLPPGTRRLTLARYHCLWSSHVGLHVE